MEDLTHGLLWATTFTLLGTLLGVLALAAATGFLSRLIGKLTPDIDEEKEILRGNVAVAQYFGRVVSAAIIGVSLIIATSILAGIHG